MREVYSNNNELVETEQSLRLGFSLELVDLSTGIGVKCRPGYDIFVGKEKKDNIKGMYIDNVAVQGLSSWLIDRSSSGRSSGEMPDLVSEVQRLADVISTQRHRSRELESEIFQLGQINKLPKLKETVRENYLHRVLGSDPANMHGTGVGKRLGLSEIIDENKQSSDPNQATIEERISEILTDESINNSIREAKVEKEQAKNVISSTIESIDQNTQLKKLHEFIYGLSRVGCGAYYRDYLRVTGPDWAFVHDLETIIGNQNALGLHVGMPSEEVQLTQVRVEQSSEDGEFEEEQVLLTPQGSERMLLSRHNFFAIPYSQAINLANSLTEG